MKRTDRLQIILDQFPDESFLVMEGHNNAILGVEAQRMVLAYSVKQILKNLQKDMTRSEALEYFEFNMAQAHMGEKTPVYVFDTFDD